MIQNNEKTNESCQTVTFARESGNIKIIWVADMHQDSKKSRLNFLKRVIKKYPDAYLVFGGDSFDVMQNTRDPRAAKSALKESLLRDDYLNAVIEEAYEFYKPFKNRILAINLGNHGETQIRMHGIDIVKAVVDKLNIDNTHQIICGDLAGWIKLRYKCGSSVSSKNIYFSHQPISGGARSKGILSADILKGRYPDADIWISEHIHTSWTLPIRVERFTDKGKIKYENKWYIQAPTLKEEFQGKKRGYIHAKTYEATPIGVAVIEFDIDRKGALKIASPKYELID